MLGYTNIKSTIYNLVVILQGLASFVLVVLSFARYMSGDKKTAKRNFTQRRDRR